MNAADIQKLQEVAKHDATVARYLRMYGSGQFSFEDVVMKLALQLASEKASTRKQLRDTIKGKSNPTLFGMDSL